MAAMKQEVGYNPIKDRVGAFDTFSGTTGDPGCSRATTVTITLLQLPLRLARRTTRMITRARIPRAISFDRTIPRCCSQLPSH